MSTWKAATMVIASIVTVGCNSVPVSTTPGTDTRFGESLNIIKAQQTINPNASRNTNPVTGIDGKAARAAIEQYRKSFGDAKEAEGRASNLSVNQTQSSGAGQ